MSYKYIYTIAVQVGLLLFIGTASIPSMANPLNKKEEKKQPFIRYELGNSPIYKKGWIDFNKNGVMDIYENPEANIDERIEDLLAQMNLEEKTCQMVTLYGYGRVLQPSKR